MEKYHRIIVEREDGEEFIAADHLTLEQAEEALCHFLNEGCDAYIQDVDN